MVATEGSKSTKPFATGQIVYLTSEVTGVDSGKISQYGGHEFHRATAFAVDENEMPWDGTDNRTPLGEPPSFRPFPFRCHRSNDRVHRQFSPPPSSPPIPLNRCLLLNVAFPWAGDAIDLRCTSDMYRYDASSWSRKRPLVPVMKTLGLETRYGVYK